MPIIKNGLLNQSVVFFFQTDILDCFLFLLGFIPVSSGNSSFMSFGRGRRGCLSGSVSQGFFAVSWPGGRHMTQNRSNERKHIMMGKGSDSGF